MKRINKEEIIERADTKINIGAKTKAIVAFVDLLGFSFELLKNWEDNSDDFLHRIMRIKSFAELCKEKGNPHDFKDFDETTTIGTSEYPLLITFSDSFIFIKEMDNATEQTKITSILSVLASIEELWSYSIKEGFTIRGAIDFGEFFYTNEDILGPAFISAYKMESKKAKVSRIICSNSVKKIINENILAVHPTFQEYCKRWFKKDIDDEIILNPCIAFGLNNDEALQEAIGRVEKMRFVANDHAARNKYTDLIEKLNNSKDEYSDLEIFKSK